MKKNLSTTGQVIEALGGSAAVSKMCGVGTAAVSVWRVFNRFPAHHYPTIQAELVKRRHTAPPGLFNFERKRRLQE